MIENGTRFTRLVVIEQVSRKKYSCKCDCNNIIILPESKLLRKHTKSCGCLRVEKARKLNKTHGMSKTKEYYIYKDIKNRCTNENSEDYKNYGKRGITIDPEWLNSFERFIEDVGKCPYKGCQLDRKDNNKGYCKDNVRWTDRYTQANNKRNNHNITYNGITKTLAEWSRETGIKAGNIRDRIYKRDWSIEKALFTPIRKFNCSTEYKDQNILDSIGWFFC